MSSCGVIVNTSGFEVLGQNKSACVRQAPSCLALSQVTIILTEVVSLSQRYLLPKQEAAEARSQEDVNV